MTTTNHKHSPLFIECVLKAHYLPVFEYDGANVAKCNCVRTLVANGILDPNVAIDKSISYTLTEKGEVFLDMILNTPYPIEVWADPRN